MLHSKDDKKRDSIAAMTSSPSRGGATLIVNNNNSNAPSVADNNPTSSSAAIERVSKSLNKQQQQQSSELNKNGENQQPSFDTDINKNQQSNSSMQDLLQGAPNEHQRHQSSLYENSKAYNNFVEQMDGDKKVASSFNQYQQQIEESVVLVQDFSTTNIAIREEKKQQLPPASSRHQSGSGKSPRKSGSDAVTPKRAITASNNYQSSGGGAAQAATSITNNNSSAQIIKKSKGASGGTSTQNKNKTSSKNKEPGVKGSAGHQRNKQISNAGNSNEVKMLSSQQNNSKAGSGAFTASNRSNSMSRRSGASGSSMAVNQVSATSNEVSSAKRNKMAVKNALPRQKTGIAGSGAGSANLIENGKKGDKGGNSSTTNKSVINNETSKQAASLEKAKIAEEIKLNVAAVGMDLLYNSNKSPAVITKVNSLIGVQSPKGLGGAPNIKITNNNFTAPNEDDFADDEDSPKRLHIEKQKRSFDNQIALQDQNISINRIENTDYSDEDVDLGAGFEEDIQRQLKLSQFKHISLPPPLELIAKTVYKEEEAIQTGAPISFISLAQMAGGCFRQEEQCGKTREQKLAEGIQDPEPFPVNLKPDVASLRASTNNIQQYMAAMNENGYVVYCRFGREYIGNLLKQHMNLINNPNLSQPMRQVATYLINIKKLMKDHNIDSESKDFNKLKTCKPGNMKKKAEQPPTPFYNPIGQADKTLVFESRFETGNLLATMKVSDNEYDMVLQNDINTNGHTQWFFFRVGNTQKNLTVKFNILNLAKPDSLYNEGMKVLSFSQLSRDGPDQLSWHRVGTNISYHQNSFKREGNRWNRCYYTLTFTHTFTEDNDQVYFAHCFPYTYSDLQDDLQRIERDRFSQNFVSRSTLCRTLAGNRCEYITITSKEKDPHSDKAKAKRGVFISSRVHPGESNASWMMKGVIEFLVSNTAEAQALRENFVFKIVPMLNPDGVINGNYRCSLAGQDLNRRWKIPSKVLHPVNWHVKRMIRDFNKEREIVLVCDLHGHSRRKNIFMYGNNFDQRPHATRVFPFIMSKLLDYFSFEYSRFSVHKSKEATARITLWRELKIPNVFTMEASFCGANKGQLESKHFMPEHFMLAGRKLLEALIVYTKLPVPPLKPSQINATKYKEISEEERNQLSKYKSVKIQEIEQELTNNKKLIEMTKGDEDGDESAGSDSEPSEDNLSEEEMAKIIPVKRKESPNKQKKKPELVRKSSATKLKDEKSPSARGNKQPVVARSNLTRSPIKRIFPYQNPYDRMMRRGIKKVEMVDAWTQTSNRGSDAEESKKKQQKQAAHQQQKQLAQNTTSSQQHQQQLQQHHQQAAPMLPGQLAQIHHQRLDVQSTGNHDRGRIILDGGPSGNMAVTNGNSMGKKQRQSVENIHHLQSYQDPKTLQLQQDRRLAQIHRQNTHDQSKMHGGKKGPQSGSSQNNNQNSQQQLQMQNNNVTPNMNQQQQANQIRIRKDPIKQIPGYKKPPSLAIYEEALMKQTGGSGSNPKHPKQYSSSKHGQQHHTLRSSDATDSNSQYLLNKQAVQANLHQQQQQQHQQLLAQDRSPDIIGKNSGKIGQMMDNKGKTFTATRLGNFSNGNNEQQFFQYTGVGQNQHQPVSQVKMSKVGSAGPHLSDSIPQSLSQSQKKRAFNREQSYLQTNLKEPTSPSKRIQQNLQNQAAQIQQSIIMNQGPSQRKASVQRSPLISNSFNTMINNNASSANNTNKTVTMGQTRESLYLRQMQAIDRNEFISENRMSSTKPYQGVPLVGSANQNKHTNLQKQIRQATMNGAANFPQTSSSAAKTPVVMKHNVTPPTGSAYPNSSNRTVIEGAVSHSKIAEFRSNRNPSFKVDKS